MEGLLEYVLKVQFFLILIVIFGLIFFVVEKIRPAEKNTPFFKKDLVPEFLLAFCNTALFQPVFSLAMLWLTVYFLAHLLPYQIFDEQIAALPYVLQILCAMLVLDFSVYWRHRFTHFGMWSYHSIHHSAEELTWMTKLRLHPGDVFAAAIFDALILYAFGFSEMVIFTAAFIMTAYDFYAHANLNVKYPKPLRFLLASPHSHRWHHANVREAYDKNFCSVFSFYDVMFGTFYHPEELPPIYGLSKSEQKDFPRGNVAGWFWYPFKREWKRFRNSK